MLADRSRHSESVVQPAARREEAAGPPEASTSADVAAATELAPLAGDAGALDFVRASLDARLAGRRREMVEELLAARSEAAVQVRAAQRESAAIVRAAAAELIVAFLNGAPHPSASRPVPVEASPWVKPTAAPAPVAVLDPVAIAPSPQPQRPRPHPPGLRRFVHLDTVLPLLAALIVLVILLAWVG